MRATLEFNLPDDEIEFTQAVNASKMALALWEYDQALRAQIKYQNKEHLQEARDMLYRALEERGLTMEDLA